MTTHTNVYVRIRVCIRFICAYTVWVYTVYKYTHAISLPVKPTNDSRKLLNYFRSTGLNYAVKISASWIRSILFWACYCCGATSCIIFSVHLGLVVHPFYKYKLFKYNFKLSPLLESATCAFKVWLKTIQKFVANTPRHFPNRTFPRNSLSLSLSLSLTPILQEADQIQLLTR